RLLMIDAAAFSGVAPVSHKSSIFLRRKIGLMFMRVNSKCAHQVRPPSLASGGATKSIPRVVPNHNPMAVERNVDWLHKHRVACLQNESQGARPCGLAAGYARRPNPPHSHLRAHARTRHFETHPTDI